MLHCQPLQVRDRSNSRWFKAVAPLTLLLFVASAAAQFDAPVPVRRDTDLAQRTTAAARAAYEANLQACRANPDFLVLDGLLADRKRKRVEVWTRATGIPASDPVEFWAIPTDSGKDYESLLVAFAKPSDLHRALEFVGMKPGRPIDYAANQYWPKGERVRATLEWEEPPANAGPAVKRRLSAEEAIVDIRTKKPLPVEGLVFVGSHWFTPEGGKPVYAADVHDSKAIASSYNNRSTVLDVPRQAPQNQVYGSLKLNPTCRFLVGQPVRMILEPEHKDGVQRVVDLKLAIRMPGRNGEPREAQYLLTDDDSRPAAAGETLVHLLAALGKLTEAGKDPFVTIAPDDAISLGSLRRIYGMLMEMDHEKGIRIEAPPPGHLYYRAFFPNEEWRDRNKRLGRPWELHLVEKDRKVAGTLILPADDIDNNNGMGDLKFTVGSAEETARLLAEKSGRFSQTVFVYAPSSMAYGSLMAFIRPAMKTHPGIHIFP